MNYKKKALISVCNQIKCPRHDQFDLRITSSISKQK